MLDRKEMGNQEEMTSGFSDWKKKSFVKKSPNDRYFFYLEFNPPKSGFKKFSGDNLMDI